MSHHSRGKHKTIYLDSVFQPELTKLTWYCNGAKRLGSWKNRCPYPLLPGCHILYGPGQSTLKVGDMECIRCNMPTYKHINMWNKITEWHSGSCVPFMQDHVDLSCYFPAFVFPKHLEVGILQLGAHLFSSILFSFIQHSNNSKWMLFF